MTGLSSVTIYAFDEGSSPIVAEREYIDRRGVAFRVVIVEGLREAAGAEAWSPIWMDPPQFVVDMGIWDRGGRHLEWLLEHEARHREFRDRYGMTVHAGARNFLWDFSYLVQRTAWRWRNRRRTFPPRKRTDGHWHPSGPAPALWTVGAERDEVNRP
jgi:hypothetical protein